VAEGRNRIYEREAPPGQLANSLLAHAEVDTLVSLDPERRYEDHVLYTALEPRRRRAGRGPHAPGVLGGAVRGLLPIPRA
jgi:hypothetical protein